MIETLSAVTGTANSLALPSTTAAPAASDFGVWLTRELENVNDKINVADTALRKLAVGEAANLHETMMALEQAKLSFELVVQVRNRILEAYQDVMRMQV